MSAGAFDVGTIAAKAIIDFQEAGKTRFDRAYDAMEAKAAKPIVAEAKVNVDSARGTRDFQAALDAMRAKAKSAHITVEPTIDPNLAGKTRFDRAVSEMEAKAAKTIVVHADVDADTDRGAGRFIDSMGRMREANGRFVKATEDGFERVKDSVDGADEPLRRHNKSGLDLTKTYQSLNKAASALPRPLQLIGNALVAMSRAGASVGTSLGGSGGGAIGAVVGLGGGLAGLGGAIGLVLVLLIQLAGAAVAVAGSLAAAAAGAAALGAGLAAAFGPFLAIGVAVVARIVAITQAYNALSAVQEKGGAQAKASAQQHRQAAQAIQAAEQQLADARRNGAEAVARAQQQLDDARRAGAASVGDAEDRLADTVAQTTQDIEQAQDDLVDAREQALDQISAAQRQADDARVSGAEDVARAEQDLADTQKAVTRAQVDLTKAREEAARQTEDLAAAARHAATSEEGAQITLREAKKRLAEVQADPTSSQLDIDEAIHNLHEAQDGLEDARTAKKRADEDAAAGTTKVKEAQDALTAARVEANKAAATLSTTQRQSAIAISRADSEAAKARQDAAKAIADAETNVTETTTSGAKAQAVAQRHVADAVADAARATKRAAEAVSQARDDEARSIQRASEAVANARESAATSAEKEGAAAETAKEKLAQLTDTERKLLTTVRSFVGALSSAFRPATDAIFDGVNDSLHTVEPLLGRYKGRFGDIGEEIGDLVRRSAKSLTSPEWTHALDEFVATADHIVKPLGDSLGSVVEIIRNVAVAAQPYVRELVDGLADSLGGLADSTDDAEHMSGVIGGLIDHTKSWWHLLVDVGKLIYTIFNGGAEDGKRLVDTLDHTVKRWTAFLDTEEGQRKMREFFKKSVDFVEDLADTLADVVGWLVKMGNFVQDHTDLIKAATAAWVLYKAAARLGLGVGLAPGPPGGGRGPGGTGVGVGVGAAAGNIARSTLYGAAVVGGVTAVTQAFKGPSGTDVGLVNKYADAIERVAKSGDAKGMRDLAGKLRDTARANQDLTKGENLKRFADALDATAANGGKSLDALMGAFAKLPPSIGGNIEQVRRDIAKLGQQRGFDQVDDALGQSKKNFDTWRKAGGNNLKGLHQATEENMRFIRRTLGSESQAGKDALAGNFKLAMDAVKDAMSDGKVTTRDGLAEIRRLMKKELTEVYGLTDGQAKDYLRTDGHGSGHESPRGGHQRGGYVQRRATGGWIGARGMVSDDIVPIGDNAIAALGEYLAVAPTGEKAVINRHQAPIADMALAMSGYGSLDHLPSNGLPILERAMAPLGGLDSLFSSITRPHNYASGGYVQGATPAGGPAAAALAREMFSKGFNVTSAFRDTSTFHGRAGTGKGDALDFGDSANDLRKVWSVLFPRRAQFAELFGPSSFAGLYHGTQRFSDPTLQAGHQDHIHVAILKALSGALGGAIAKTIKAPSIIGGGGMGGVVQSALNVTAGAANTLVQRAGASRPRDEVSVTGVKAQGADTNVVAAFRRAIAARRAAPVERLALWEAGIVESGLRNLPYGDADSLGSLQERTSIYGRAHAMNPFASALRFLSQAAGRRPWRGSAGSLAQAVQVSRYPDRYDAVAGQARGYMARGGLVRRFAGGGRPTLAPGRGSSTPQRTTGGSALASSGSTAIGNLRTLQTDRIGDYDNWMTAAANRQSDYEFYDRKFSISVEELIDPETGAVNVDQVKKRASELIQLSVFATQRTDSLKKAQEIAKRVVATYRTIVSRLRRARSHISGNRRFRTQRRDYYDGQITTYTRRLNEWIGKLPDLKDSIRDSKLDVEGVTKEYQDVMATSAAPSSSSAPDTSSDPGTPTDDTPTDPPDADNSQALADQQAIAAQANARADALAGQVATQESAIRTLGGAADFAQGGRNAMAAAGGANLPASLQGVGGLSDVIGNPLAGGAGVPIVVQQFGMLAAPRDPATLTELGSAAVAGIDYLNPKSSPRVDSLL